MVSGCSPLQGIPTSFFALHKESERIYLFLSYFCKKNTFKSSIFYHQYFYVEWKSFNISLLGECTLSFDYPICLLISRIQNPEISAGQRSHLIAKVWIWYNTGVIDMSAAGALLCANSAPLISMENTILKMTTRKKRSYYSVLHMFCLMLPRCN